MVVFSAEAIEAISSPSERLALINEALRPPEPQLLDTCVLQNLDWVDRQLEDREQAIWDDAALLELAGKYGAETANDLVDLGVLYNSLSIEGDIPGWSVM